MAFRGRVLYEFVCASGANLNDGTFEILSNPLASCLVNHWMTTNCLPSESIKNAMHFPKYRLLFVERSPSEIRTFTQSCATTPWYRGIARKKTVCDPIISLKLIWSWVATRTGGIHCNTSVLMAVIILLKIALFASSESHLGKPSHESVLRYIVFFLL